MKLTLRTGAQIAMAGAVLIVAATYVVHLIRDNARFTRTDNAYVEADIAPISSLITGDVAEILVSDHQRVRKGDLLARLNPASLEVASTAARADIAALRAELAATRQRILQQSEIALSTAANIRAAEAGLTRAASDHERVKTLVTDGWVAEARLDTVRSEHERARAEVSQWRARLTADHSGVAALKAEIARLEANILAAEAALDQARISRGHADIHAPIDGVVGARSVRLGQKIRPGQQLMMIVPIERAYVMANFKETQLAGIAIGQKVTLKLDAFPKEKITGRVESFSPAAGSRFALLPPENASGNFTRIVQRVPVRIAIDPGQPIAARLAPGLSAAAKIDRSPVPAAGRAKAAGGNSQIAAGNSAAHSRSEAIR